MSATASDALTIDAAVLAAVAIALSTAVGRRLGEAGRDRHERVEDVRDEGVPPARWEQRVDVSREV